ncbi:hypothetical protein LINPERHAP2_LOCUS32406 [Linum perenne]
MLTPLIWNTEFLLREMADWLSTLIVTFACSSSNKSVNNLIIKEEESEEATLLAKTVCECMKYQTHLH